MYSVQVKSTYIKNFLHCSVHLGIIFVRRLVEIGGCIACQVTKHARVSHSLHGQLSGTFEVRSTTTGDFLVSDDQLFSHVAAHCNINLG